MMKIYCSTLFIIGFLAMSQVVSAQSSVPAPFQSFDKNSKYVIIYDDVTALLKTVVVEVGRSTRKIAQPTHAKTGTMVKSKVKRTTSDEANRFYFETFEDNEKGRQLLSTIKTSLERLPDEVAWGISPVMSSWLTG